MKFPILVYHSILPKNKLVLIVSTNDYAFEDTMFENQMKYLHDNGFSSMTFSEINNNLNYKHSMPAKPVVITFDDGTDDNYLIALPILQKYNLKAIYFIVTDLVGKKGYLNWDQIIELPNRGMEIQSHTHTHGNLSELSEDEIERELSLSKKTLEEKLNNKINVLALPYGRGDNKTVKEIARASGYQFACTSTWGDNNIDERTFYLERFSINTNCSMDMFKSFVELEKKTLLYYKMKKMPVRFAKMILGKTIYSKIRSSLLKE